MSLIKAISDLTNEGMKLEIRPVWYNIPPKNDDLEFMLTYDYFHMVQRYNLDYVLKSSNPDEVMEAYLKRFVERFKREMERKK